MPGLYSKYVFPGIVDWVMSADHFSQLRRSLLSDLEGAVLEIGFGTGLNLPYYPESVTGIVAVDVNPGMVRRARARIRRSPIPVELKVSDGASLPLADRSFRHVVSAWTLCSIASVENALDEIYRVLEPGGAFLFLEHGLGRGPRLRKWQRRLTPLQKVIGDGCHLDRDIEGLIRSAGFEVRDLETFYMQGVPRIGGYTYKGTAIRPG